MLPDKPVSVAEVQGLQRMLKKKILEANKTTFSDKTEILSNEPFYYDAINKKLLRFADMVAVSKVVNDLSVL